MIVKKQQVFNLADTNGRCNPMIEAHTVFLETLYEICDLNKKPWENLKKGYTTQYDYYEQVKETLKDIFEKNEWYELLCNEISKNKDVEDVIRSGNKNKYDILENKELSKIDEDGKKETKTIADIVDIYIEARARHYTNNLFKIGFTDKKRTITEVGYSFLDPLKIEWDEIEKLLPISNTNLLYLRQLMKLRVFDSAGKRYYSPFNMALYALLLNERISRNIFCDIVQGLTPYDDILDYCEFVEKYNKDDIEKKYLNTIPNEINNNNKMDKDLFKNFFSNGKSGDSVDVYYEFYEALYDFINKKNDETLDRMLTIYEDRKKKSILNKAYGYGNNIFENNAVNKPKASDFLKNNDLDLFKEKLNAVLYLRFKRSKRIDAIKEYFDTTMRIFKATGLISFDNGYVELACRELCLCIFDREVVKSHICGDITSESINNISDYEDNVNSYYCSNHSIISVLGYSADMVSNIMLAVQDQFEGVAIADIPGLIKRRRKADFDLFVEKKYPEERVKSLLAMFSNRSNDKKIKKEVYPDATVPTIYEYIVGLAWYYFSNKTIDLLNSFNLTLSANFEPLTHAGGGMGDIVIREDDKVIMLEATLMNANSQKRGEWEPVLRHSVNLKVEEENLMNREVTTFFIADSFDFNTINIWKAISSVPLQSSTDKDKFTDSVIIMPINNDELLKLMDRKEEYGSLIRQVRELFLKDITSFDKEWREKFMRAVMT